MLQRELSVMPLAANWMAVGSIQRRSPTELSLLPHTEHYATNRQVAGSIPYGVTGIFQ